VFIFSWLMVLIVNLYLVMLFFGFVLFVGIVFLLFKFFDWFFFGC